jgi:hypothetical protein
MTNIIERNQYLPACTLTQQNIEQLIGRLQNSVASSRELERNTIVRSPQMDDADFHSFCNKIDNAQQICIVIIGSTGDRLELTGNDDIFNSPNLPNIITHIYIDNCLMYQRVYNRVPQNWFALTLDFSKPPLMDWQNPVSNPTPNDSKLQIHGTNELWVAGIRQTIMEVIEGAENKRDIIHSPYTYDVGLMLLGFPLTFYLLIWMTGPIQHLLQNTHSLIIIAAHMYAFVLCLHVYKILFSYTKWAFPKLELKGRSGSAWKHRAWWFGIVSTIASTVVTNILSILTGWKIF